MMSCGEIFSLLEFEYKKNSEYFLFVKQFLSYAMDLLNID